MHNRTAEALWAIAGLAGVAALGVLLGNSVLGERRRFRRAHGADPADRDDVAELIDRFARTLPENEAEIMLRRNKARLRDW